jgi:hypothetical protein
MTSNQECDDDEDITTSDTTTPSNEVHGPFMRSRAQQLRHQVNLFLYSSANDLENRWLPNDLIVIRNQGVIMEDMWDIKKVLEIQGNTHNKVEVQANSESSSLTSSPTSYCLQIDV